MKIQWSKIRNVDKIGCYLCLNLVTGKYYVGSTADSFKTRWTAHIYYLRKGNHRNRHLQSSWKKHGEDNFKFVILKVCNSSEECLKSEQKFIDCLKAADRDYGYNTCFVTGTSLGVKRSDKTKARISKSKKGVKVSEETKEKLRIALTGRKLSEEVKDKLRNIHLGSKHSDETKKKISKNNGKGRLGVKDTLETIEKRAAKLRGYKHSEETRHNMSLAAIGRKHTEETKKKISQNNARFLLGKHHSEESRKKMSKSHTGKKLSDETKQKLSETLKRDYLEGRKPSEGMTGKKHSEETRLKMSASARNRKCKPLGEEHKANLSKALKGKSFSEETKERMRREGKGVYGPNHSNGSEKRIGIPLSEGHKQKLSIASKIREKKKKEARREQLDLQELIF